MSVAKEKLFPGIINLILVTVVLLHIYAGLVSSGATWGFHHLCLFPLWVKIFFSVLLLSLTFPVVQHFCFKSLEKGISLFQNRSLHIKRGIVFISIIIFIIILWIGRERTYFLGDGYLVLRSIPHISSRADIPVYFQNEPLTGYITWNLYKLLSWSGVNNSDEMSIQLVSIVFGVGSCLILIPIVKRLFASTLQQALFYLFVNASGSIQLFFGYMENYSTLYFGVLMFLLFMLKFIRGEISIAFPAAAFGVLFTLHFGMIAMLPALIILFIKYSRRGKIFSVIQVVLSMVCAAAFLLWLCGYSIQKLWPILSASDLHRIPLSSIRHDTQAYTLFDFNHFLDIVNLHLLLSPFSLIILFTVFTFCHKKISWKDSKFLLLFLVALSGLGFTFIMNADIGMSRDWDLFASYNVGIIFLAIYILINFFDKGIYKQRIIVGIIGITLLHTFTWILINANADKSIEHFKKLQDGRFWSKRALTYSSEELAIYYANQKDYSQAIRQYKKYLAIDSLNSRIWGNLGTVYSSIRDRKNYIYAYEKAIAYGSTNATIYAELANLYYARKQYSNALNILRKGIKSNLRSACLYDMTGVILEESRGELLQALPFYMQAIAIDSTYAPAFWNAGRCYMKMRDTLNMQKYLKKFIQLRPDDPQYKDIHPIINSN